MRAVICFILGIVLITALVFSCEQPLPAANTFIKEPLIKQERKPDTQWVKTLNLTSGLYCIAVKIPLTPEEQKEVDVLDDFIYDGMLLAVVESGRAEQFLADFLNSPPLTKPENVIGFWYLDENEWVKHKLPCQFGVEDEPEKPDPHPYWYERKI